VIIGARTRELLADDFPVEPLEAILVKGKDDVVQPFRVFGPTGTVRA
jgi:hypothetical protein